ncbi:MAG: protein phosphatase 2C domain-containing protein [Pseudomonadota bacterium]
MWLETETTVDAATAISQGARQYQEDAVVADFPLGTEVGFMVLSDGMGGHAAGDVASKIVMTEVFTELKFKSGAPNRFAAHVHGVLRHAAASANAALAEHVADNPEAQGMGATLLTAVLLGPELHWISIGDSPLFLFRDGALRQLNEDHSMAPQIDFMAQSGLIDPEAAKDHPDRNCLTSVLNGGSIARIDCPESAYELVPGDIVIAASDGVQYLDNDKIEAEIKSASGRPAAEIADRLLQALHELGDPDQDNISMTVVRIGCAASMDMAPATDQSVQQVDGGDAGGDPGISPRRVRIRRPSEEAPKKVGAQR